MSIVSGQLLQQKISAGAVSEFGQSLRTFIPNFQICPSRNSFDNYGREAPPDSINTQTCPGAYPSSLRIEVENSLRPFVSPTYWNLPVGISGNADTLFGRQNTSRLSAFGYQQSLPIPIDQLADGKYQEKNIINWDGASMGVANAGQKYMGSLTTIPTFQ